MGRYQKVIPVGPESHLYQNLGRAGEPVITTVATRTRRGYVQVVSPQTAHAQIYTAVWKYPTVTLWKQLEKSKAPVDLEMSTWRHLLLSASFLDKIEHEKEQLTVTTLNEILQFIPSLVPSHLYKQFIATVMLTSKESFRIEQECYSIWSKYGTGAKNTHPLLEEIITAMNLYDKFGLTTWGSVGEMHVKTYQAMRQILNHQSKIMSMNVTAESAHQRALHESGMRRR